MVISNLLLWAFPTSCRVPVGSRCQQAALSCASLKCELLVAPRGHPTSQAGQFGTFATISANSGHLPATLLRFQPLGCGSRCIGFQTARGPSGCWWSKLSRPNSMTAADEANLLKYSPVCSVAVFQ